MRKSLILVLTLLMLASCGFGFAHTAVSAQQDKVVITEQVVSGDPAAAEGVRVKLRIHCNWHMLWETHYAIGAPDGTYSDFAFTRARVYENVPYYDGVQLSTLGGSVHYSGAFSLSAEENDVNAPFGMKLYRAVAENTNSGSTHTEVLRVRDYYDCFPIQVFGSLADDVFLNQEKQITAAITEFFRIPVPEDYRLNVTVTKDDAGNISEMEMDDFGYGLSIWTQNVLLDGACYFTMELDGGYATPPSTSLIPGGAGIYCLTYGGEAVGLETVFPLDPAAMVYDLHLSEDERKLLLTTCEEDTDYLTVIDLETMTELQKLPLLEHAENSDWWGANYNDDFLVVTFSDEAGLHFVVLSVSETGDYAVALRGTAAEEDPAWSADAAMDWNGETLAVAARWIEFDEPYMSSSKERGFSLSIYDADGQRYTGQYGNSLMDGSPQWAIGDKNCYFTDADSLTVTLP